MGPVTFFDVSPAQLKAPRLTRPPRRLRRDQWEEVHANRLERMRRHGAVSVMAPQATGMEVKMFERSFGLGFFDGPAGALSHHLWIMPEEGEYGPWQVMWMAYSTFEQLRELLAVLKSFQDQVHLLKIPVPSWLPFYDLVEQPARMGIITRGGGFATGIRDAWWVQVRVLDLLACVGAMRCEPLRFGLELRDPVERYLPEESAWRGVGGRYEIALGPESQARRLDEAAPWPPGVPVLKASAGAFSRLWFGVAAASVLAFTDEMSGPPELIKALDEAISLPRPDFDWDT